MSTMETETQNRLDYFPITAFAAVLGLGGFTVLLNKWYHLRWLPGWPYHLMVWVVSALVAVITVLYARKMAFAFDNAAEDYWHKIRSNFVAAISISMLILSIVYMGCCPFAALSLWYLGTVSHTVIMFVLLKRWINHEFNIVHFNPAWFIPVVGLVLIPVAGVDYVSREIVMFYWAAGTLFWLIFFTIALYRIIFHPPMPAKLAPTFFMLLAPPSVIFISWVRITMRFDLVAQFFLLISVFMAILLFFIKRQFSKINFYMSWWAFTFPLDAFAIAMSLAVIITRGRGYMVMAWISALAAAISIAIVTYKSFIDIKAGKMCVREE